jgi:hypothetical protein
MALDSCHAGILCIARRKAVRRVRSLPSMAHSDFLPLLNYNLPIFDEIPKIGQRAMSNGLFSVVGYFTRFSYDKCS